jgi:hypothetical protein
MTDQPEPPEARARTTPDLKTCSTCGTRMVFRERRDYGSPTDVQRITTIVWTWNCPCGYEEEIGRTPLS